MAKTVKERVRAWREKKSQEGGRSLSAWLEPETSRKFQELQDHFGESTSPLVARMVETLYGEVYGARFGERATGPRAIAARKPQALSAEPAGPLAGVVPEPEPVAAMGEPAVLAAPADVAQGAAAGGEGEPVEAPLGEEAPAVVADPLFEEMVQKLRAGVAFKEIRGTLLREWMTAQKAAGVSFEDMAERLNAAAIPTLGGKGRWQAGMIPVFLLASSTF